MTFAPIDVAVDHNGDVFATNRCGASGCGSAGQISFWTALQVNTCFTSGNNPAMCGPSGLIYDPLIYQAYFLDVNQAGTDLFVDYFDSTNTAGLDEITSPLGTPAVTNLIPANPIPFAYPGGVEVSRFTPGNRRLTLVDQSSRAVYQLGLPPGTFPRRVLDVDRDGKPELPPGERRLRHAKQTPRSRRCALLRSRRRPQHEYRLAGMDAARDQQLHAADRRRLPPIG